MVSGLHQFIYCLLVTDPQAFTHVSTSSNHTSARSMAVVVRRTQKRRHDEVRQHDATRMKIIRLPDSASASDATTRSTVLRIRDEPEQAVASDTEDIISALVSIERRHTERASAEGVEPSRSLVIRPTTDDTGDRTMALARRSQALPVVPHLRARETHVRGFVPDYMINNVVFTVMSSSGTFDLQFLAKRHNFFQLNPKEFAAMTVRILKPKATVLIFDTGKMVFTGVRSIDDARLCRDKVERFFCDLGIMTRLENFNVQNIVAKARCCYADGTPFALDMKAIDNDPDLYTSYRDDFFPGCVLRHHETGNEKSKFVALLYNSGNVVITGLKTEEELQAAWKHVYETVCLPHAVEATETNMCSTYNKSYRRNIAEMTRFIKTYQSIGDRSRSTSVQVEALDSDREDFSQGGAQEEFYNEETERLLGCLDLD